MKILKLRLKNYRNCEEVELDLDHQKILILGKNAQGKTNILESIFFLSCLKSPRTSNNLELIKFNEENFEITSEIEKAGVWVELNYYYDKNKKKEIKLNTLKTTPKEFKQVFKTVLFSTQDLMLLRGTPEDRRDWLDRAISQVYPAYDDRLTKYNKVKSQKNNFLKDYDGNDILLDVFNEQINVLGSNIIYLRKKFLQEIEKIAQEKHTSISESEQLTIKYDNSFLTTEEEIDQISEKFKQKLQERKELEIIKKQSLVGPHRDDVIFYINNEEGTKYASQGQQRTVVLALKLAEIDIITQKTGEPPVLLLDDVLAELDNTRQNYLLNTIEKEIQTIITSVDTVLFDKKFLKKVKKFEIANGKFVL